MSSCVLTVTTYTSCPDTGCFTSLPPPLPLTHTHTGMERRHVDEVVLVGGSTRVPMVKKLLR